MQRQREKGALNWVFNIIEGRTEQEDVMYREHGEEGFLLLPDLNWDRKTMGSLHLLGLVERRDIWSVRDLKRGMVEWVRHMREKMLDATVKLYPEIERDQLKLYVHCKLFFWLSFLGIAKVWRLMMENRSTDLLPLPYPYCPCRARGRQYTGYR